MTASKCIAIVLKRGNMGFSISFIYPLPQACKKEYAKAVAYFQVKFSKPRAFLAFVFV